jgi:uncharacterized membrane protein
MGRVKPGTPGGISSAGTLAGLAAALLLALVAWSIGLTGPAGILIVTAAAFIGALFESLLHATVLAGRSLGSLANLTNTMVGALIAFALSL